MGFVDEPEIEKWFQNKSQDAWQKNANVHFRGVTGT